MFGLENIDLISVAISISGVLILGFTAFFNDNKSITNQSFFFFSIAAALWGVANYLNYQFTSPLVVLWLLRIVVFLAVWYTFFLFQLCFVFPRREIVFPRWYRFGILPIVALTSLINLSPLVFPSIAQIGGVGEVSKAVVAPGIFIFVSVVLALVIGSIFNLVPKIRKSKEKTIRNQALFILLGISITFILHLIFNLVLPGIFLNVRFIPLGALFTFPLIALTFYAISRYHFLNVKVVATEILVFSLVIAAIIDVIFAQSVVVVVLRVSVFLLILALGILLIRSVQREVEQREEIQRLAEDLKVANERLKELDKLKSQFLSIASHDLRAPLTTIRNFMSLLLEEAYGKLPTAAEEGMRRVFDQATEMAKSVDNYLNVSRIEQGRMKYDWEKADLVKILSETAEPFKSIAEKKGLSFTFRSPADLKEIPIKADVAKLHEVFALLIDNSIKYTPEGSIAVNIQRTADKVARVTIQDTGVGISKETMPKLFKLFSTDENSKKVNTSSTGVGLYVVKAHIEAHGGKVWAESEGDEKGSTFIIELPIT